MLLKHSVHQKLKHALPLPLYFYLNFMKRFFKIKLEMTSGPKSVWVGISACSVGEAIVIADTCTIDSSFDICADSVREITPVEYYAVLHVASFKP